MSERPRAPPPFARRAAAARVLVTALGAVVLAGGSASRAEDPPTAPAPPRFGGEVAVRGSRSSASDVPWQATGIRMGVGVASASPGSPLHGWGVRDGHVLLSLAGDFGETEHGLRTTELRLGLSTRVRWYRLLLGLDPELYWLGVERRSTSGRLRVGWWGLRGILGVDLLRFGRGALFAGVEGAIMLRSGKSDFSQYAASAGMSW